MNSVFNKIYDEFHQDLYQFIFYMVKDKHLTEDLLQEVYIKVLNSHKNFKGDSSLKTWLFSIARHVTIDHFRAQERKRKRILEFFDWNEKGQNMKDNKPLPDEVAVQNEEVKQIYEHLDKCTPDQKSVLILRFIQSFSIRETADILKFSTSKVKTTQHRGLKMLRKYLEENKKRGGESNE
ncbi:RNA polymerase sigma factor SigX [Virgibacillus sp. YIM 98842]|uniref:RNA polymerase sigma factor SigX n=1 Tax=Virgibacillus sp. YIM 98842 TaxID=2663533 RepID=UPI0013DC0D34|nr:RNA polymerase sigma factor SigX [Virgibacillus sp. YIM 98842]